MHDLYSNVTLIDGDVVTGTDNTALVSPIIDTRDYLHGVTFGIITGTLADVDATFVVLVEEGDAANLSDATAVADADLVGTEALAGFTFAADGTTRKIGYMGTKRYVRCTITPSANSGSAPLSVFGMGVPRRRPAA